MNKYLNPDFLLCEIPIKDGSFNDNRLWVYSLKTLSLIEFINVDNFKDFEFVGIQERFEYENSEGVIEHWFGIFTQNNCEITGYNEKEVINESWMCFKNYLIDEDLNLDNKNKEQWN